MDKDWNDNNKLNLLINNCINIENNIKEINNMNDNLKKCNLNKNIKFKFSPEEHENNDLFEKLKLFGQIRSIKTDKFIFKKCPQNINESRKYELSGENENILTKTGTNNKWMGTICENELEKGKEYKWKIKILNSTEYKRIIVGIAPIDFDINSSIYNTCGWYIHCYSGYSHPVLWSGPPHNYKNKATNLKEVKDEIILVMNMKKRALKFIIDNEDKGDVYTDIPIDKPLFPAVLLYDKNDSIEIINC